MPNHAIVPRRGITTLIATARRAAKHLDLSPKQFAAAAGIGYDPARRILKGGDEKPQTLYVRTEEALQSWLCALKDAGTFPVPKKDTPAAPPKEEQLELDMGAKDPGEHRTIIAVACDEMMQLIAKVRENPDLHTAAWISHGVHTIFDNLQESQVLATSAGFEELIGKMEETLAAKDEEIILLRNTVEDRQQTIAMTTEALRKAETAGAARFQLGKDTATMSDPERSALQALLNKTETENVQLRAALKAVSQTL
jgi:hypothetical protein